ncbi:MAG: ribbon-helix-helix domain-containing protein [Kiloniellales bacterium]|nr:ribbon-helix-helix domain-containing protein [Kiloniellales bacterium]
MWGQQRGRDSGQDRGRDSGQDRGRDWGQEPAGQARGAVAAQAPQPRVVQHRGRRYSIRLETIFWRFLDHLAARHDMRLGRYIAGLAASYAGNNLSSYLRVVCMLEAERRLAKAHLDPRRDSLLALVRDCPSPGVIVSRSRTILGYNTAFAHWLGPGPQVLAGSELTDVLQVRAARPLNEVWADMIDGAQGAVKAHVLRISPGRASAAQATIVPLRAGEADGFYAVMWLEAKRAAGPARSERAAGGRPAPAAPPR